ncbi:YidC/Oxa1 family membrane protein insertase [Leadbettera azotonutricia]|uniref:Inner membrane protein n=1 Tax=Leadbettera azotonutricia (strain ATCC BAA-888 / DSM 13862 / ZAS-9) TaxID=545695 RepID=F5YAU9_LEAAZ|nr:YidC/Oxa1 family membrane protein insertase [Leadbettera azotonutricia]AEF82661.1 inner membrane protein [Leadbettera azotonutricia ZAS-9]
MLDILFNIIIYPIKLLLECVYMILSVSVFKDNIGVSLAGLSITVNLLCLPLYTKAEKLQEAERDIQKRLAPRAADIKKYFKGDERYMILSMHYRENHYHPIMALRSSLSLLIQIPFFIAAYTFLSHLDILNGRSLFILRDLSAPDALFTISSFKINALPVLMTIINIGAGLIYSRGFPLKDKVQLYLMSLVFLVLLYNSPSVLVLYWTFNNIFSLVKNILFKIKNPFKIIYFLGCLLFAFFMIYVVFIRYNEPMRAARNKLFAVAIFIFFACIPFFIFLLNRFIKPKFFFLFNNLQNSLVIMTFSCFCLLILVGCYIPFNIVSSDPIQFATIENIKNLFTILIYPAVQAVGFFLFWPLYIFFLSPKKLKSIFAMIASVTAITAFINLFIFSSNYGIISQTLNFQLRSGQYLAGTPNVQILNILACIGIFAIFLLVIYLKKSGAITIFLILCVLSITFLSGSKLFSIKKIVEHDFEIREQIAKTETNSDNMTIKPIFTLSKTGKNIFIIMLDTAVNSYFKILTEKRPDVAKAYNGFTYYPNILSFYRRTLFGAPPLFGGYEYSTYNMNKRSNILMKDKQNEAILLLPLLFKKENYDITITDMPYIDYGESKISDFYGKYDIKGQNIQGLYNTKYIHEVLELEKYKDTSRIDLLLKRNFLLFSILETTLCSFRDIIYQNGKYWSSVDYTLSSHVSTSALNSYSTLYYLPELTKINDNNKEQNNTFTIMINDLTHEPSYLQYPDFTIPAEIIEHGDNFFGNNSYKYYHVNSSSYILLSKWFDYLRSEGVWDNTLIIIVSDHGESGITNPDFTSFQNNHILSYNPILLVKNFSDNSKLKINNEFMTNADIPLLALEGNIVNPTNPFTKNKLTADKKEGIYIFTEGFTNTSYYNGTTCLEDDSKFYHVRDNIFEPKNWQELKYGDFKNNK